MSDHAEGAGDAARQLGDVPARRLWRLCDPPTLCANGGYPDRIAGTRSVKDMLCGMLATIGVPDGDVQGFIKSGGASAASGPLDLS